MAGRVASKVFVQLSSPINVHDVLRGTDAVLEILSRVQPESFLTVTGCTLLLCCLLS